MASPWFGGWTFQDWNFVVPVKPVTQLHGIINSCFGSPSGSHQKARPHRLMLATVAQTSPQPVMMSLGFAIRARIGCDSRGSTSSAADLDASRCLERFFPTLIGCAAILLQIGRIAAKAQDRKASNCCLALDIDGAWPNGIPAGPLANSEFVAVATAAFAEA